MLSGETDLMPANGPYSRTRSPIHLSFPLSLSSLLLSHHLTHFVRADGLYWSSGKTASSFSDGGNEPWRRIVDGELVTLAPRGTCSHEVA